MLLCNSFLLSIVHFLAMPIISSSSPWSDYPPRSKPRKPSSNSSFLLCKHSPSATLDILILILVLGSCAFLIASYFTYIFTSLSRILPLVLMFIGEGFYRFPIAYIMGFLIVFAFMIGTVEIYSHYRFRKCEKPGCRGLKKAMDCDIQLQTEECLRNSPQTELDSLPWKGGIDLQPEYTYLQSELRRMAPPNGRAVLLFRASCGCPVAKLEAWGPKRTRKHKKGMGSMAIEGVADRF